jgi:hypothetical protein
MKVNRLAWLLLFLMLGVAAAQQTNSSSVVTNSETIEVLKAKAEKGDAEAQFNLGASYDLGQNVAQNPVEAVEWYLKAAKQGNVFAQNNLAVCYAHGKGVAKDEIEAVKWYRKSAEQNLANAQCNLGYCYANGQGVAKDEVEAVKWYRKSAEQNYAEAQNNLGGCYYYGQGVAQDYAEALKWFQKAAEQGCAPAQSVLGGMYFSGQGGKTNYDEAAKWFRKAADQIRKAAEQGDATAQSRLGGMYKNGIGVMQDYVEAAKWYRRAAEQGDAASQSSLGGMYEKGQGVTRDYVEAAKWYRRAAEQGDMVAQSMLGNFYSYGTGVPKNNIEAYMWWDLASAHSGNNEIEKKFIENNASVRDLMVKIGEITPEEVAEAQRLAAAFVPRKETSGSSSSNSTSSDNPTATGTGFFITEDGYLISNYHVVKDATKVRLVTSAGTIDAKVVQVDAANDLALLKADGKFSPLPISASRMAHLGGTVATIGFPDPTLQGFAPKLAKGEIASLSGAADDPRYFQISVPVQPGNSGGALVDERGNVIGIVSAKLNASVALAASGALPENVNYAVKSSFLLGFLESVPDVSAKLKAPNTADKQNLHGCRASAIGRSGGHVAKVHHEKRDTKMDTRFRRGGSFAVIC